MHIYYSIIQSLHKKETQSNPENKYLKSVVDDEEEKMKGRWLRNIFFQFFGSNLPVLNPVLTFAWSKIWEWMDIPTWKVNRNTQHWDLDTIKYQLITSWLII